MSADTPDVNQGFIKKYELPFTILSDVQAVLVSALGVPRSTLHPMAKIRRYPNGFSQPGVFIFDAEGQQRFSWIQTPKMGNFYGAAKRMGPEEIISKAEMIAEEHSL